MEIHGDWRRYNRDDDFESSLSEHGWWDEGAQVWFIEPAKRAYVDEEAKLLVVGRAGVDGVVWGRRVRGDRNLGLLPH